MWVQYKHQATGRSSVARSTKQKAVISALCFLFLCAALSWLRCRPSSPRHYVSLFLSIFFPRRSLLRRPSSAASSLLCFLHLYRTGSTISFMLYYRTSSKKNPHLARCIAQWRHNLCSSYQPPCHLDQRTRGDKQTKTNNKRFSLPRNPSGVRQKPLHSTCAMAVNLVYISTMFASRTVQSTIRLAFTKAKYFLRRGKCR